MAPPSRTHLGLYLHLPFCPRRCPYCDFYATVYRRSQAERLLAALGEHLPRLAPLASGRTLGSVYLGGGTPSMLPARAIAALLEAIARHLGIAPGAEITLEANPGTVSPAKLRAWRAAGVGRLSLGVQSFDPEMLAVLRRSHGAAEVRRAVAAARRAGFGNLNLDLIYGLPGQDRYRWKEDLAAALALEPEHLSLYELTLAPHTPFGRRYHKGRSPLPGEDEVLAMEETALEVLAGAGLTRYEVSNFARPGRACRHNLNTWRGGDYLALGPGAHGHLAGRRWAWVAAVEDYCRAVEAGEEPYAFCEELTPRQRALELVMLGLRTSEGVDLAAAGRLLGRDPYTHWRGALGRVEELGWARLREGRLVPTALGLRMADAAAGLFA